MSEDKSSNTEISVTQKGVVLRGAAADDMRPPLQRLAKTADTVLRLIDNVVGLPADYLSLRLETFREKYREQLEKIPPERRQEPPLRVGCAVLRHVAYAAEEPDIQELFARLLATASDVEKASTAHPGFASVINDLQPEEAKLLLLLHKLRSPVRMGPFGEKILDAVLNGETVPNLDGGLSNLLRLGLVEWHVTNRLPSQRSLQNIAKTPSYSTPQSITDVDRLLNNALQDVQNVKASVIAAFRDIDSQRYLRVTVFGKQFLEACMPTEEPGAGEQEDQAPLA
jgi:hypothetical protein